MESEARKRNTIDLQRTKGDVLKMAVRIPSPELLKTVCKCQDCHLYETATNPFIGGRWGNEDNHSDTPILSPPVYILAYGKL